MVEIVRLIEPVVSTHRQRSYLVRNLTIGISIDNGDHVSLCVTIRDVVGEFGISVRVTLIDNARVVHLRVRRWLKIYVVNERFENLMELKAWGHRTHLPRSRAGGEAALGR